MPSKRKVALAVFFACLMGNSGVILAQSSPNVPIDDPVYRDIDRLVGLGLVPDVIYGQRPWSRREIVRLVAGAVRTHADLPPPLTPDARELSLRVETAELLERLKTRFQEEMAGEKTIFLHPLSFVRAEYVFVDADVRDVLQSNGLGAIDAFVSPLTAYHEGRHYPDGHQFAVETEHHATLTRFFSVYARPRFQLEIRDNRDAQFHPFVQQLYGKFTTPHLEIEAGRDSLIWGQGEFGGILLSNNARPLDLIKVSNPSPTVLPWLFKYFGPLRYTFFVANLGPEREFPRSFLTGFKLSFKPASFVELGFDQIVMLGGEGAPGPLNVGNVFQEFFGFRVGDANVTNLSNRQMGFDLRFFFPFLRNSQLYVDAQIEDLSSISYMMLNTTNYQAGFYMPRLSNDGSTSLRLEYHHGSPYFARHAPFITGMALNRRILGDELGPQADGIYIKLYHEPSERLRMAFGFDYERRDGDILGQVFKSNGDRDRLVAITGVPAEHRIRPSFEGQYHFSDRILWKTDLQYQFTQNFNFVAKDTRSGFLMMSSVRFDLF